MLPPVKETKETWTETENEFDMTDWDDSGCPSVTTDDEIQEIQKDYRVRTNKKLQWGGDTSIDIVLPPCISITNLELLVNILQKALFWFLYCLCINIHNLLQI